MHHGDEMGEKMERLKRELELGATGHYPEGALDETDEGEIKLAVGVQDGKVVINFGKPVAWIGFGPQQARQLAETIRKWSYRCGEDK